MNIAAIWLGLPKWVRDAIMIGGAILAVVFLGRQYIRGKQNEAVQRYSEKAAREALEVERDVVNNIEEHTREVIAEADAVREHTAASVLPDGTATLPDNHYRD